MKVCPSCSASVPDSAAVCPSCLMEFDDEDVEDGAGPAADDSDLEIASDPDPQNTLMGMPGEDDDEDLRETAEFAPDMSEVSEVSDVQGGDDEAGSTHFGIPTVEGSEPVEEDGGSGELSVEQRGVEGSGKDTAGTRKDVSPVADLPDESSAARQPEQTRGDGGGADDDSRSTHFGMPSVDVDPEESDSEGGDSDQAGWVGQRKRETDDDGSATWGLDGDQDRHTAQGRAVDADSPSGNEETTSVQETPPKDIDDVGEDDERYQTQRGIPRVDTGRIWKSDDAREESSETSESSGEFEYEQENTPTHLVDSSALEEVDRQVSQMEESQEQDRELWRGPTIQQAISDSEARDTAESPDFPGDARPDGSESGSDEGGSGEVARDSQVLQARDRGDEEGDRRGTSAVINLPGGQEAPGESEDDAESSDEGASAKDSGVFGNSTYILGGRDPGRAESDTESRQPNDPSASAGEADQTGPSGRRSESDSAEPLGRAPDDGEGDAGPESPESPDEAPRQAPTREAKDSGVFGDEDRGPTGFEVDQSEVIELEEQLDSRPLPRVDDPESDELSGPELAEPGESSEPASEDAPPAEKLGEASVPFESVEEDGIGDAGIEQDSLEEVDFEDLEDEDESFDFLDETGEDQRAGVFASADEVETAEAADLLTEDQPDGDVSGLEQSSAEPVESGGEARASEPVDASVEPDSQETSDDREAAIAESPPEREAPAEPDETTTTGRSFGASGWLGLGAGLVLAGYVVWMVMTVDVLGETMMSMAVGTAGVAALWASVGSLAVGAKLRMIGHLGLGGLATGAIGAGAMTGGIATPGWLGLAGGGVLMISGLLASEPTAN